VTTAEKYVTAAYAVFLGVLLLYIVIYAFKMSRLEREVRELAELAESRSAPTGPEPERERAPAV
jgi:hypothetical protein